MFKAIFYAIVGAFAINGYWEIDDANHLLGNIYLAILIVTGVVAFGKPRKTSKK